MHNFMGQMIPRTSKQRAVRYSIGMHRTRQLALVVTITTTLAIFMSGICAELHYHGPDPAFVLAFVGSPSCLRRHQMSRLCRLCILSNSVNNETHNVMEACGPFAHRHIDIFFCMCGFVLCFQFPRVSLRSALIAVGIFQMAAFIWRNF